MQKQRGGVLLFLTQRVQSASPKGAGAGSPKAPKVHGSLAPIHAPHAVKACLAARLLALPQKARGPEIFPSRTDKARSLCWDKGGKGNNRRAGSIGRQGGVWGRGGVNRLENRSGRGQPSGQKYSGEGGRTIEGSEARVHLPKAPLLVRRFQMFNRLFFKNRQKGR